MDITTRHHQALEDWGYAQHLSQCVPVAHRPIIGPVASFLAHIPLIGSAIRSLQRIRYLGALSQRQLMLNQIGFDQAQFHGHFMASTNEVLATLQCQMADVLVRQEALEERLLGLHETLLQSDARQNTLEAQLNMAASRIDADLSRVTEEVRSEVQQSGARLTALEDSVRMQSSQVRLLRQDIDVSATHDRTAENGLLHPAGQVPALIALLESQMPELRGAGDVGLSVHGDAVDDVLFALFTYFGDRLGTTEDAIAASAVHYHIDFCPCWNCPEVFEGAARKLVTGGHFVVITDSADRSAAQPNGFSPVVDRVLCVDSASARVAVWRNEASLARPNGERPSERAGVS